MNEPRTHPSQTPCPSEKAKSPQAATPDPTSPPERNKVKKSILCGKTNFNHIHTTHIAYALFPPPSLHPLLERETPKSCHGISDRGTGSPFFSVRAHAAVMEMMEVRAYQWRPTQTQPNPTKRNQTRPEKHSCNRGAGARGIWFLGMRH